MQVTVTSKGEYNITEKMLKKITKKKYFKNAEKLAQKGLESLAIATPKDTGTTAASWDYAITTDKTSTTISWTNDNCIDGYYYGADGKVPLVILLVYGHGTKSGYYVPGNDFVTPAITPYIDAITAGVWNEVTSG